MFPQVTMTAGDQEKRMGLADAHQKDMNKNGKQQVNMNQVTQIAKQFLRTS